MSAAHIFVKPRPIEAKTAEEWRQARAELLTAARGVLAGEDADLTTAEHLANYHAAINLAAAVKMYLEAEETEGVP